MPDSVFVECEEAVQNYKATTNVAVVDINDSVDEEMLTQGQVLADARISEIGPFGGNVDNVSKSLKPLT